MSHSTAHDAPHQNTDQNSAHTTLKHRHKTQEATLAQSLPEDNVSKIISRAIILRQPRSYMPACQARR
jgi:hypothetical protein